MKSIEEIKEEIEKLPKGYISNKTISGKTRHYLQWTENGKVKSLYLREEDYERVKSEIEQRKELQNLLRAEERKNVVKRTDETYEMNVVTGEPLKGLVKYAEKWKKRDCYKSITAYLYGQVTPRVCSVYGLRRTGKTTMLHQAIGEMRADDFKAAAYIKVRKGQTMAMLDKDLKTLAKNGYKYIFIDEITFMDDFVDTASLLSDIYAAMGMKIVISGTDSLGLWFASKEELYDRAYMIHTTWIPFSEHSRLLDTDDIDEYIRYGGTLRAGETDFDDEELKSEEVSFRDDESTRRYIDTAICGNIQHSLKCYENGTHFRKLRDLYEANELTGAINRIIESMNHRFVVDVLMAEFKSNDLALARKNLLREKNRELRSDALEKIDEKSVTKRLMEILEIENEENQRVNVTAEHVREIKEYLAALELIEECPVRYIGIKGEDTDENVLFTQPGMRYCQAQALVYSLKKDELFSGLKEEEKDYVCGKILNEVKGRMLEEIVLYETMRKLQKTAEVFKLQFASGEFDMVVMDKDSYECKIYEIKHAMTADENQYKHLIDGEKCAMVEKSFGKITGKYVLYRGSDGKMTAGIEYLNVSEYLKGLDEIAIRQNNDRKESERKQGFSPSLDM